MLLLLSAILPFAQNSKSIESRDARIKEAMELRDAYSKEHIKKREEAYAKRDAYVKEAIEVREAYFREYAKKRWDSFLKVPGTSLPKSPDSLNIKTVEIPKIKEDENPNIEIIDALLKEGISEEQAVNIALEIIDSLGIDAIKEGQSIGIFTEENKAETPVVVSYMIDSSDASAFLRNNKADGYKYVESEAGKNAKRSCFTTNSSYVFPLKGSCRRTSKFGMREHPVLKKPKKHEGVDYGAAKGNEIYSIADGTVIESAFNNVSGYYVVIIHAGGLSSHYCHLQEMGIKKGVNIVAGQAIGKVGSTGRSTGPHLHLGIKQNGKWVDPEKILNVAIQQNFTTKNKEV